MGTKRQIKLGDEIQDVVTKAQGIAHGRVEYLDGTVYWIIQPPYDAGEKVNEVHAPAQYCVYVGPGVYPEPKKVMGFVAPDEAA